MFPLKRINNNEMICDDNDVSRRLFRTLLILIQLSKLKLTTFDFQVGFPLATTRTFE